MSKYPNLSEIVKYHPYHIGTFAYHADVTLDLLQAALNGQEELYSGEIIKISRLVGVPVSVLICPKLIMLDKNRLKHKQMIRDLISKRVYIRERFQSGSLEAKTFMQWYGSELELLHALFTDDKASYGRYLGLKSRIDRCLKSIYIEQNEKRRRSREKQKPQEVQLPGNQSNN